MTFEETIRAIVREEIRSAIREMASEIQPRASGAPDDRLTLAEAAAAARRSSGTVKRWTETGQLKCSRRGRTILITRGDLDSFLRAEARPGTDAEIEALAEQYTRRGH